MSCHAGRKGAWQKTNAIKNGKKVGHLAAQKSTIVR